MPVLQRERNLVHGEDREAREARRIGHVINQAERLTEELTSTVAEVVKILREYQQKVAEDHDG